MINNINDYLQKLRLLQDNFKFLNKLLLLIINFAK